MSRASTAPAQLPASWPAELFTTPPRTFPAPAHRAPGVQALFFENVPYRGQPTRVFAWMGMPYLPPGRTCPAMVLLHGGGGTAFDQWVRLWNQRGYAAIAIDQCGCTPDATGKTRSDWPRHEHAGPAGWGKSFACSDEPLADQWPYHAVAAAVRAHTLLASQPGVDPQRVGVTGISWGGYLTCLTAGVDARLRCAVPVYGCGFLGHNSGWRDNAFDHVDPARVQRWLDLWDPSQYLPHAGQPFLWVSGTNDSSYPLDSLARSYGVRPAAAPLTLCLRPAMPHGHSAGWAPAEIMRFADSHLADGAPLPRVSPATVRDGQLEATFQSVHPLRRAELVYTRALGHWRDRTYNVAPAEVDADAGQISVSIPGFTTVCYLNLIDDAEHLVSTPHVVLEPAHGV